MTDSLVSLAKHNKRCVHKWTRTTRKASQIGPPQDQKRTFLANSMRSGPVPKKTRTGTNKDMVFFPFPPSLNCSSKNFLLWNILIHHTTMDQVSNMLASLRK